MKFVRKALQRFTDGKEKEPCEKQAEAELNHARDFAQSATLGQGRGHQFCETRRTEDAIVVLGDALAAEIPGTFRTARSGFPFDMVEAALMSQISHVSQMR